ncbi:hypothetical protein V6N13_142589 [Hibiscus sabdariffa]|uniref:Triple gene block 3 protein n=1 Tax=Hibiscus sabdariffa TaxID=183260 RepID=A0ABR2FF04_9ROSI
MGATLVLLGILVVTISALKTAGLQIDCIQHVTDIWQTRVDKLCVLVTGLTNGNVPSGLLINGKRALQAQLDNFLSCPNLVDTSGVIHEA